MLKKILFFMVFMSTVILNAANNPNEPPINIIFDVHIEHMGGGGPDYFKRRAEVIWLKNIAVAYGAKLSLQSNGEYMEYCLENGHKNDFKEYLEAGFNVGTHPHLVTCEGPHNWINHSNNELTFELVDKIIGDAEAFVDLVVGSENNFHICTQTGKAFIDTMMKTHQFDFFTGPGEEGYFAFGHMAWSPFRQATGTDSQPLEEDLTTQFVAIPHLPQINKPNAHGMNLLLPQMKRRFLMIYIEWLSRVRNNANDKIWVWGFCTHPCQNFAHREAIEEILSWLNNYFINRTIHTGDTIAVYATGSEIYQKYLKWESENPGISSFNFLEDDPYPYTYEDMPSLLENAEYERAVNWGKNLNIYRLLKNGRPIYILWTNSGSETIDFTMEISGKLKTTDGHGNQTIQNSSSLIITEEPLFVEETKTINGRR